MKNFSRLLAGICIMFSFVGQLGAQSRSQLEDAAYEYLNNFEFAKAYKAFSELHTRYPKEMDYHFKLGLSALSCSENKVHAIDIFEEITKIDPSDETQYYLARAYHANYLFKEAIAVLQPLIDKLTLSKKRSDRELLRDATVTMNNCVNGRALITQSKMSNSEVKNLGAPINTHEVEGVPIITADESMMIFTYIGKKSTGGKLNTMLESDQDGSYLSDIYLSTRNADNTWGEATPITALNTKANDAAIAISPDGHKLFTFLSNSENVGDIFVSTLNGHEFSQPMPLNKNINHPDYWEGSCSISADGNHLYFASERPIGGYGGRDIWVSELVNDDWGPPVNLGPTINTALNDDAPFIHHDGVTLVFSSEGHSSIGGYDIMYSSMQNGIWQPPVNMGVPLNTVEDDRYYVINSSGDQGYFSSDRSTAEAKGGHDIYTVTPGIVGEKLIVALFKGIVYGNNKPIEAKIEIIRLANNAELGPFVSNKITGKYLFTLKPGSVYKLRVVADGFDPLEEEVDLEALNSYIERNRDYRLYTKEFAMANPDQVQIDTVKRFVARPIFPAIAATAVVEATAQVSAKETEAKQEEIAAAEPKFETKDEPGNITPVSEEEKKAIEKTKIKEKAAIILADNKTKEGTEDVKTEDKKNVAKSEQKPTKQPGTGIIKVPFGSKKPEVKTISGKSLNDAAVYKEMLELAGDYSDEGVVFKVQIGAYRKPENFKYDHLKWLGKVEVLNYPDGITRFTQEQFKTIREAESHRQKAICSGQPDAWIVVFVNGTRYTLEEMIKENFRIKPVE